MAEFANIGKTCILLEIDFLFVLSTQTRKSKNPAVHKTNNIFLAPEILIIEINIQVVVYKQKRNASFSFSSSNSGDKISHRDYKNFYHRPSEPRAQNCKSSSIFSLFSKNRRPRAFDIENSTQNSKSILKNETHFSLLLSGKAIKTQINLMFIGSSTKKKIQNQFLKLLFQNYFNIKKNNLWWKLCSLVQSSILKMIK